LSELPIDMRSEGWNNVAETYEKGLNTITRPYSEDLIDALKINKDASVLDIACGGGVTAIAAANAGGNVLATDYAAEMIKRLDMQIVASGEKRITTKQMNAESLDVDDGTYDFVTCGFGLMFVPDKEKALNEILRVLKPGGKAGLSTWAGPAVVPGISMWKEFLARAFPKLESSHAPPPIFSLSDPSALGEMLATAGFTDVTVTPVSHIWRFESPQDLWDRLHGGTPVITSLTIEAPDRERLRMVTLDLVAERYGDGVIELPGEAFLAIGNKSI
jgi:ubiquinone/menaquinone biosynthesis C-methylase UbiE